MKKEEEKMFKEFVRKYEKNSMFVSILMLILSLFLIFMPIKSVVAIIWIFSIFVIVDGIIHIVSYCKTTPENRLINFEFAEGIMEILSGVLMLISADYLVIFLPILLGVWMIVKSIIKMQMAINFKDIEGSNWVVILICSIITLLLGIFIIANPFPTVLAVTISVLGIALAVYEIINIVESAYTMSKLK